MVPGRDKLKVRDERCWLLAEDKTINRGEVEAWKFHVSGGIYLPGTVPRVR